MQLIQLHDPVKDANFKIRQSKTQDLLIDELLTRIGPATAERRRGLRLFKLQSV
jgi:hypothetical protein